MFADPEYVDLFEDMALEDHDEKENQRARTQGTSADTEPTLHYFCNVREGSG